MIDNRNTNSTVKYWFDENTNIFWHEFEDNFDENDHRKMWIDLLYLLNSSKETIYPVADIRKVGHLPRNMLNNLNSHDNIFKGLNHKNLNKLILIINNRFVRSLADIFITVIQKKDKIVYAKSIEHAKEIVESLKKT